MKNPFDKNGFTLLEIIIVTIIVATLMGLVLTHMSMTREKNISAEGKNILLALWGSEKRYNMENDNFTNALNSLDVEIPASQYFNAPTISGISPLQIDIQRQGAKYTLNIAESGTLSCNNDSANCIANDCCSKIGF